GVALCSAPKQIGVIARRGGSTHGRTHSRASEDRCQSEASARRFLLEKIRSSDPDHDADTCEQHFGLELRRDRIAPVETRARFERNSIAFAQRRRDKSCSTEFVQPVTEPPVERPE